MGATQSEVDAMARECRELKREQANLMIRMDNLDAARDRLTTQFTTRHVELDRQLTELRQDYAIAIHALNEDHDELKQQVEDIKTAINNLRESELSYKSGRGSFLRRKHS